MSAEASEMVSVPRVGLEALQAELRRLRREVGRGVARARMLTVPGPSAESATFTREQLAEAWGLVSDRLVASPGAYEPHLPAESVTIWYTVAVQDGQEVISIQHVSLDT